MIIEEFRGFDCQTYVDELCTEYRKLDSILGYPKEAPPRGAESYYESSSGQTTFQMSRFLRGVAVLDRYRAMINRLDVCLISVEYFQGGVNHIRNKEPKFADDFVARFFASSMVDSFRSVMDIYAKVLGSYFELPEQDATGFEYKRLISPLKLVCPVLSSACNSFYARTDFELLRDYRNSEKHEGFPDHKIAIDNAARKFSATISRTDPVDAFGLTRAVATCLTAFRELLITTTLELSRWPLGFQSPRDKAVAAGEDGFWGGLPKT